MISEPIRIDCGVLVARLARTAEAEKLTAQRRGRAECQAA